MPGIISSSGRGQNKIPIGLPADGNYTVPSIIDTMEMVPSGDINLKIGTVPDGDDILDLTLLPGGQPYLHGVLLKAGTTLYFTGITPNSLKVTFYRK